MRPFYCFLPILMGALFVFASCDDDDPIAVEDDEPIAAEAEKLASPQLTVTVQDVNTVFLTWTEVTNAAGYVVSFDGVETEETACVSVFTDLESGTYEAKVKAVAAEDSGYADSDWATGTAVISYNSFTFEVSDLTALSATVVCTPSDLESTYFFDVFLLSEFNQYSTDDEFIESRLENIANMSSDAGISYEEGLEILVSEGVDTWTPTGMDPASDYIAYAFGVNVDGTVTSPLYTYTFQTDALPEGDIITLGEVGTYSISFTLSGHGYPYRFAVVDKGLYDLASYTEAEYLLTYGLYGEGDMSIDWVNGEDYQPGYAMSVRPDSDYMILAAYYSSEDGGGLSPVERVDLHTEALPSFEAEVNIVVSDITSSSATITVTPADNIVSFYVMYTYTKSWYDSIIDMGYGSMMSSLVKTGGSQYTEEVVINATGLSAATEYYIGVVAVDSEGAEALVEDFYTTAE